MTAPASADRPANGPELLIVGAGAAGLRAAITAARAGCVVRVIEKTPRTGTKVLASGGTRCNLTTTLDAGRAAALFGRRGERFLGPAFRALPPSAVRAWFEAHGVPTVTEPALEKVFPASQRAIDVRAALERAARAAGAVIETDQPVTGVERQGSQWQVATPSGTRLAANVLLCPGGLSYPSLGTTGDGYAWLRALGLEVVAPVPALVPLTSPAAWVRGLTGIAVQDVEARLCGRGGRVLGRRRRPVLFTHHGVSGPGAMDLAEPVARQDGAPHELLLDLAPGATAEALRAQLVAAAAAPGAPRLARSLPVVLPRRLWAAVAAQAGLTEDVKTNALTREQRHRLVEAVKGLAMPIDATLGFAKAEVTAGGLALEELDPGTMRVKRWPGLWACGEMIDLQGPIGGLNFQAAFATAELAALDVARGRVHR